MDLASIVSQTVIYTRVLGMRVDDKGLELIRLEVGKHGLAIGKMEFLTEYYISSGTCLIVLCDMQEARRAAKKAYDVAKVEERVNKAVGAARVIAVQKQMGHV
ncbi:hypothetical protein V6N11_057838 [Hibiscus sabdariffa]|uniref:Uncharacterized protein n=1 Tax=Hibiscus sabdariffa TaxID=183260 RepID=A0ABR2P3Q4_9ROSI